MQPTFKILIVEDDDALRFIIKDHLEENGYAVEIAVDGQEALDVFERESFDIILLDVMLPKIDGFKVARTIRNTNDQVPIIFLTARSMTEDKIAGLTAGGDDYISKPFSMEELLLKILIFLRRSHTTQIEESPEKSIQIGQYSFQPDELTLSLNGEVKSLTFKEAELIQFFSDHRNKVLSRKEILKSVWGSDDYFLGRSLDVFISRLRKYFKADQGIKIKNLHGIGFRFSVKNHS